MLTLIALSVVLGSSALVFWATKKPATSFERGDTSWENTLPQNGGDQKIQPVTEQAADSILSEYIAAKKTDGETSQEDLDRITGAVAEGIRKETTGVAAHTLSDLKLVSDSAQSYRDYGNAIGLIFSRYEKNTGENEITIMRTAFSSKSSAEISKLSMNVSTYAKLSKELATVPTPKSLADIHLRFLNGYDGMARALGDIQTVFSDSVRGMVGIALYDHHLKTIISATIDLQKFFSVNTVSFTKEEPGLLLLGQ